jgi:hypothetical protein
MGNMEMTKWRSNLKSLTCSIAPLVLALLAIGSGIIATRSAPAQPHGPQISYLANGADDPNQLQTTTSMTPRATQKINSSKYHMVQGTLPDGVACNKSSECYHRCCNHISDVIHVCGPVGPNTHCAPG